MQTPDHIIDPAAIAKQLGISRQTVYRIVDEA
jgi:predicted DNA-binding transcriptional regulator AlpA